MIDLKLSTSLTASSAIGAPGPARGSAAFSRAFERVKSAGRDDGAATPDRHSLADAGKPLPEDGAATLATGRRPSGGTAGTKKGNDTNDAGRKPKPAKDQTAPDNGPGNGPDNGPDNGDVVAALAAVPLAVPIVLPVAPMSAPVAADLKDAAPAARGTASVPAAARPAVNVAESIQPVAAGAQPAPTIPAAQVTALVFGLSGSGDAVEHRSPATDTSPRELALQALSMAAGSFQAAGAVTAVASAQGNTLDMRRDDWPQAMIDRIEALHDAADAVSTRITLVPDALGKVDIALRHDGDTVNVHFAADTAATRAMLVDAQPKLADAAQARGLRLGQATVDAGGGNGGSEARQPAPRPMTTPRPARPVPVSGGSVDALSASTRLA